MPDQVGDDTLRLERQVCFTLAVASREIVSLYRPLLEPLGLTHPQFLVMLALWEAETDLSVKQLSALLKLEAPTLSPLLKRLEHNGLVERQRNPDDERSILVRLTDRGDELRVRAAEVPPAIFTRLGMTMCELTSLRDALTGVIEHTYVPEESPEPRPDLAQDPAPETAAEDRADVGLGQAGVALDP